MPGRSHITTDKETYRYRAVSNFNYRVALNTLLMCNKATMPGGRGGGGESINILGTKVIPAGKRFRQFIYSQVKGTPFLKHEGQEVNEIRLLRYVTTQVAQVPRAYSLDSS